MGPVIIATGGFGADFSQDSLLAKYRSDLMHLPTSNGEHCTGDGIKMGESIGARTIDLEWVQVHPTGLVNPKDPDAKVKFLAAEALRGVGGLIFDSNGKRFANELGRRDYVTGEMWKNKAPFRLCLNKAASEEIIWHCKHYTGRGVMKFYDNTSPSSHIRRSQCILRLSSRPLSGRQDLLISDGVVGSLDRFWLLNFLLASSLVVTFYNYFAASGKNKNYCYLPTSRGIRRFTLIAYSTHFHGRRSSLYSLKYNVKQVSAHVVTQY